VVLQVPKVLPKFSAKLLKSAELSIPVGDVIRPADPLYSVARGCLIAAEAAN